eukprot:ANDGO_03603.mRNA.1 sodium/calcium exchanger protein
MILELGALILYLGLLIGGAYCVSEGGEILGSKYDATIIGGFVIAWLNTAPETIFFISALEAGKPEFAVGAMSGSVIVVSTVACGACIWCGSAARSSGSIVLQRGVRDQACILGASLLGVLLFIMSGFSLLITVIGTFEYLAFVVYTLTRKSASNNTVSLTGSNSSLGSIGISHNDSETKEKGKEREKDKEREREDNSDDDEEEEEQSLAKGVLYLIVGGSLIWFFSEPFIKTVTAVGHASHVSTLVLSFFCAPIASEAPEILEALSLSRKGKTTSINVAVSNLVGGTISKTTLLLAILSFYGATREFEYLSSYSISLLCVCLCAGVSAYACSQFDKVDGIWGKRLIGVWALTAVVQLVFNRDEADHMLDM